MPQTKSSGRKPTMMENVQTVNSAARTLLMFGIAGVVGIGGWAGYSNYVVPGIEGEKAKKELAVLQEKFEQQENDLKIIIEEKDRLKEQKDRLETSLKLLKIDRRAARIRVDKKGVDENGQNFLEVSFSEVDENGNIIGSTRELVLKGQKFFVDCWVAKFEDRYIEQADPLRKATIFTFKSIYGDEMRQVDGFPLDDASKPLGIYGQSEQSEFEKKIWEDFANVCNDASLQNELGIRAAGGEANYIFMPEEGKTYELTVRASGSISLEPLEVDEN